MWGGKGFENMDIDVGERGGELIQNRGERKKKATEGTKGENMGRQERKGGVWEKGGEGGREKVRQGRRDMERGRTETEGEGRPKFGERETIGEMGPHPFQPISTDVF